MENHLFLHSFFYLFSILAAASAAMVILSKNAIYSALSLIFVFFNSSLLILLLDLEFLAVIFVIIYIGAIVVFFLFIVMMLDIKQIAVYLNLQYYYFISGLFLGFLSLEFLYFLSLDLVVRPVASAVSFEYINWFNLVIETSNLKTLGLCLYTDFSFFFLLAGLILLVAMVGAISLTLDLSTTDKRQVLCAQVIVKPESSLFYSK